MHIGFVTNAPFPDENMFVREQGQVLRDLGHHVTVFCRPVASSRWPVPDGLEVVEADWEGDWHAFRREVDARSPDVLHVQQRRGIRRVLALRRPAVVEITSTSLRPAPLRHAALAVTMAEVRGIKHVGTANPALVGRGRPATFLAPNGYSTWALEVRRRRAAGEVPAVPGLAVYQGTFNRLRRLDRLIDAFRLVRSEVPHARLMMIGGREQEDHEPLAQRVASLGLADAVTLHPRQGAQALIDAMSRAALCVSWIPRTTGFDHQPPLKVLDAQAAGVAVLATQTAATRELLALGGGRAVPATTAAFAAAWVTALNGGVASALVDPDAFLRKRSWRAIVQRCWKPRYEQILAES